MRLSSACNRGNPLGESGGGRLPRRHWLGLGASISASDGACTGVRDGAMARVEVITGRERRRRWTEDQKRAIVSASFAPGAMVSDVRAELTFHRARFIAGGRNCARRRFPVSRRC